jgi:diguanylate cyclase (GGDEF)-like protein
MRNKLKSSLKIFQTTIKKVAKNDPSLDDDDIRIISLISDTIFFNPKLLIKYTNTLLLNQNTILEAACSDRDYINKNKKLRETIIDLNHSIVSSENMEVLLEEILKAAISTISDSSAGTVLIPDNKGMVKYTAAIGMDLKELQKIKLPFKEVFLIKMAKNEHLEPIIIRDKSILLKAQYITPLDENIYAKAGIFQYKSLLSAPIIIDDIIYGVLSIDSKLADGFSQDDIKMMEYFTSQMAIVIRNSRLISKAFHLSKYDSLTAVHNRHYFEDMAKIAFEEVARYKGQLHFVLFDLDDFKQVNDSYGHANGDRVLQEFSETISNAIRGSDVFARYGGDEFIAYFKNSRTEDIEKRIAAIKNKFADTPLEFDSKRYNIRFSYGIAEYQEEGITLEDLLRTADKNMYENKKQNRSGDIK